MEQIGAKENEMDNEDSNNSATTPIKPVFRMLLCTTQVSPHRSENVKKTNISKIISTTLNFKLLDQSTITLLNCKAKLKLKLKLSLKLKLF